MRYYEDLDVGETDEFGSYQVSKEEIIEFAEKYDPQPIHLDEAAAADSIFGELIASGWQTAALTMRLTVEHENDVATIAGVGLDDLRWQAPLRPGDTLHLRTEVVDKRASDRHDDRGYVTKRVEGVNQNDEVIISYDGIAIVARGEDR